MPPDIFRLVEPSKQSVEPSWQWPVAILMVRGMNSARAALRVRNALMSAPGVVWVEVVRDPGFVRVAHDPSCVEPTALPAVIAAREPDYPAKFVLLIRPAGSGAGFSTRREGP